MLYCTLSDAKLFVYPAVLAIYCFAAAFPFYAAINSLMYGLVKPLISYSVPCLAYLVYYRNPVNREKSVYPGNK